ARRGLDAPALPRRRPGRRAAPDRVVADLLAARRVGLGILAPAVVEEPRARIPIAVVARAHDSDRYPRTWLFHDRWGKNPKAYTARREKIRHDTIGGRTTAWVPSVQR